MVKAVIFDLDGTLVHTRKAYVLQAVTATLAELGHTPRSLEEALTFWYDHPRNELLASWGVDPDKFWQAFRKHDNPSQRAEATYPYPDAVELLHFLSGHKIKFGIVTNSLKPIALAEVSKLPVLPDAVISFCDLQERRPKPHPEGLLLCLQQLRLKPADVLFVGNADEDVLVAKEVGVASVYVDHGRKSKAKPDYVIKSLTELCALLPATQ